MFGMRNILSCIFCICTIVAGKSQSHEEAKTYYTQSQYAEAKPLLKKALEDNPQDATLHLYYGVTLLKTNDSLSLAEQHLRTASKTLAEAFLHLGDMYAEYFFPSKARAEYDKFLQAKRSDKQAPGIVAARKQALEQQIKDIRRTEDIQIIDSVVVDKKHLFDVYLKFDDCGWIQYVNSNGETDAAEYIAPKQQQVLYGKPVGRNMHLYAKDKVDEQWANERPLSPNNFGLTGNQNFPFATSDGATLYFASTDENGKYDLYVTRYSFANSTYLAPEKLNMPFNSPANDYMLALNDEHNLGCFASDRFQPDGKVCIYTFIPNTQVQLIDSSDIDYLASRAIIRSLKDSWRKGVNYQEKLTKTSANVAPDEIDDNAIRFVLSSQITYTSKLHFKSLQAKQMYEQVEEGIDVLNNLKEELVALRDKYRNAKPAEKAKLKEPILSMEKLSDELSNELYQLINATRRTELEALEQLNHK